LPAGPALILIILLSFDPQMQIYLYRLYIVYEF